MKTTYILFLLFVLRETVTAAVVKKPPAFSTPIYSDSYLPAAMQVILHAVDQLKALADAKAANSTLTSSSTSRPPSVTTTVTASVTISSTSVSLEVHENKPESSTKIEIGDQTPTESPPQTNQESTETNQETPETNYATPEANYETPEDAHATQETNHEVAEENQEKPPNSNLETSTSNSSLTTSKDSSVDSKKQVDKPCTGPASQNEDTKNSKKKQVTIDSIVEGIYEIVKPTSSDILENDSVDESKSPSGMSPEKMENLEDELEETRFTLLGEKVAQVARPTLISYLKRTKVPLSTSLQKLATLYDALSKDARKQGYAKYTGYSDEVLKVLATSGEDGIGSQLKILLKKVVERNELTRDDARIKTTAMVRDLDDDSSELSKDLKAISPLRYLSE